MLLLHRLAKGGSVLGHPQGLGCDGDDLVGALVLDDGHQIGEGCGGAIEGLLPEPAGAGHRLAQPDRQLPGPDALDAATWTRVGHQQVEGVGAQVEGSQAAHCGSFGSMWGVSASAMSHSSSSLTPACTASTV